MASSQIIYNHSRPSLTAGQIANWRQQTYTNLGYNTKYTKEELESLMDLDCNTMQPENIQEEILDQLKEELIMGEISHENLHFVLIDSCVMCTQDIQELLSQIRDDIQNSDKIILIDTHIGMTENDYKLINSEKYSNIDFQQLQKNIAFLKGHELDGDLIMRDDLCSMVLKTNFYLENQILTSVEDEMMENNQWEKGSRNEANDNAQLLLMEQILEMIPGSNGIIISNDKLLIQKIEYLAENSELNLFAFNP
jgi:hypothetical protein